MFRILFSMTLALAPALAQINSCADSSPHSMFDASTRGVPGYRADNNYNTPLHGAASCIQEEKRRPSPGGAVSFARLTHKPPKEARKQYSLAGKAQRRGDSDKSLSHLRRAVSIDPDFVEAQNNLGARLFRDGAYAEAVIHLEAATRHDRSSPEICANLAVALAATDRAAEAESWARRALRLDPDSPKNQYVLAFVLVKQKRNLAEAQDLLAAAVERFPSARPLYDLVRNEQLRRSAVK